jgi:integrase
MRAHWKAQQEIGLRLGAGKSPPAALVFCDLDGLPCLPQTVSQTWAKLTVKAGVEAIFHSLRHTHASHLIAAGVDILTISRRLGHSSPTVTLDIWPPDAADGRQSREGYRCGPQRFSNG